MLVAGEALEDDRVLRAVPERAANGHAPGVRRQRADEDLHECRLPGPVLPDQSDRLPRRESELHLIEDHIAATEGPDPLPLGLRYTCRFQDETTLALARDVTRVSLLDGGHT